MKDRYLELKYRLVALAMVLPMVLTGCGDNKLEYVTNESGIVEVTGTISYDSLKNLKLVHITNEIAKLDKYYLVREYQYDIRYHPQLFYYDDIETNRRVYEENKGEGYGDFENFKLEIVLDGLVDYLWKYDMLKEEYTSEDIAKLKELLLADKDLFPDESLSNPLIKKREMI